MVLQGIHGVVRRAHRLHVHRTDKSLLGHFRLRQHLFRLDPDHLGSILADDGVNPKAALQVQVNPLIGWISRDFPEDLCNRHPLLVVGMVLSGQVFLRNAHFAEAFPDIMVGCRLGIPDVGEIAVFAQGLDIAVVVGIDDRQRLDGGIDFLGHRAFQQITFIQKRHKKHLQLYEKTD